MTRPRRSSGASEESSMTAMTNGGVSASAGGGGDQELGSMYDYLAKIILLGPSGSGKSCLLHRFVKNEWRVLSSQTIGVEFASKIIKVGQGSRRKRIKLQLWDTAGTERFRSVSRSYYRGAAGAILVYDLTSHASFRGLQPFLNDARALASPYLTTLLAGNKIDLANDGEGQDDDDDRDDGGDLMDFYHPGMGTTPSSTNSSLLAANAAGWGERTNGSSSAAPYSTSNASTYTTNSERGGGLGSQMRATVSPEGREVSQSEASDWASGVNVPVTMEVSAFSGEGVEEVFGRLARMILTKIELGEIDPDDPMSGIQYGDGGLWGDGGDGLSIKSGMTGDSGVGGHHGSMRNRKKKGGLLGTGIGAGSGGGRPRSSGNWGMREWEDAFTVNRGRRRGGCC